MYINTKSSFFTNKSMNPLENNTKKIMCRINKVSIIMFFNITVNVNTNILLHPYTQYKIMSIPHCLISKNRNTETIRTKKKVKWYNLIALTCKYTIQSDFSIMSIAAWTKNMLIFIIKTVKNDLYHYSHI